MEREACVCDHGYERSDLCAEIINNNAVRPSTNAQRNHRVIPATQQLNWRFGFLSTIEQPIMPIEFFIEDE